VASILDLGIHDSSSDNPDFSDTRIIPSTKISTTPIYGIYAETKDEIEASNLLSDLMGKYAQSKIELDQDGKPRVFIISFMSEGLANEYKNLIQNKLSQKLVITKK